MALLLFCITSMRAPTMPVVGAGVGGLDSGWSDTWGQMSRGHEGEVLHCNTNQVDGLVMVCASHYCFKMKVLTSNESYLVI